MVLTLKQLKEKYGDEQVFIVPYSNLVDIADNFTKEKHNENIWSKYDNIGCYIYRYDAEQNPEFQQLIPYILVKHPKENKYYISKRKDGEQRLINSLSMGFGGHINLCDGFYKVLEKAFERELHEELNIENSTPATFLGYMRQMKSKTNDHLGFIFQIEAEEVSIKEIDKLEGQWMTIKELEDNYFYFEDWGKRLIDYLVVNGQF